MRDFNPSEMNQEDVAKFIAYAVHKGQFRNDKKTPYITHPEAVANSFPKDAVQERAVAWLHDVLEDCSWLSDFALRKFGVEAEVVWAVAAMTHRYGDSYNVYIDKIVEFGPLAMKVKLADIKHNLSGTPSEQSKVNYAKALVKLEAALASQEKRNGKMKKLRLKKLVN